MRPKLHLADAFDVLPRLRPRSVDLVLIDPPYGKTALAWDREPLDFAALWKEFDRICAGPVVIMGQQPFTTKLINSNPKDFRYVLVWDKGKGSNPLLVNVRPMSSHEDIVVFYKKKPTYHPQMAPGPAYKSPRTGGSRNNSIIGHGFGKSSGNGDKAGFVQRQRPEGGRFPTSVLRFSIHCGSKLHPTQKPVDLMAWLIRTYTDKGDRVLDCFLGSGTTGVAAVQEGRSFIGVENDQRYFHIASERIEAACQSKSSRR